MATLRDVRRIVRSLPESEVSDEVRLAASVGGKDFAWTWLERLDPKRARVPNPAVLAVRTADETEKQALLALDGRIFFTEPHYDGYPAVLIRLEAIDGDLLRAVLTDGWRCRAPKRLVAAYHARS